MRAHVLDAAVSSYVRCPTAAHLSSIPTDHLLPCTGLPAASRVGTFLRRPEPAGRSAPAKAHTCLAPFGSLARGKADVPRRHRPISRRRLSGTPGSCAISLSTAERRFHPLFFTIFSREPIPGVECCRRLGSGGWHGFRGTARIDGRCAEGTFGAGSSECVASEDSSLGIVR